MAGKTRFFEGVGHQIFYITLRLFGHRGARGLLVPVVTVYLLFSRTIHHRTRSYLAHRFPKKGRLARCIQSWRLVYGFGAVLVDRGWLGLCRNAAFYGEFPDEKQLLQLLAGKKGLVLVLAHVGNWQAALVWLGKLPVPVHGLMRYDQLEVAKHYFDLGRHRRPVEIIDVEGPFGGMIEAAAALQRGEVVVIMGDRYWKGPFCRAEFLGEQVRLPVAAYGLAASSGAPVAVLLTGKTGPRSAEVRLWDCWQPGELANKMGREVVLQRSAERFAAALERYLEKYPHQWYNFYDFWKQ